MIYDAFISTHTATLIPQRKLLDANGLKASVSTGLDADDPHLKIRATYSADSFSDAAEHFTARVLALCNLPFDV